MSCGLDALLAIDDSVTSLSWLCSFSITFDPISTASVFLLVNEFFKGRPLLSISEPLSLTSFEERSALVVRSWTNDGCFSSSYYCNLEVAAKSLADGTLFAEDLEARDLADCLAGDDSTGAFAGASTGEALAAALTGLFTGEA